MRALFDANVFISYLLSPSAAAPTAAVVRAGLRGAFTLLYTRIVMVELRTNTAAKPFLASRILPADVAALESLLADAAEMVPELPEPFPAVGRDRKDDYLIPHALLGQADYLVTGDNDLVSLGEIETLRIVRPAQFLAVLQNAELV